MLKNHICPQSVAINLATVRDKLEAIGKYGCLAMCYVWSLGLEPTEERMIRYVADMMDAGLLDKECTVLDAEKLLKWLSGDTYRVSKQKIKSIKEIKGTAAVRFLKPGYGGHWVLVRDGKIVFNSLLNSINVNEGSPVDARIIEKESK